MGAYKKITDATILRPRMKVRVYATQAKDYDNFLMGDYILGNDNYEIFPDGLDYKDEGALFYISKSDMIAKGTEYWEE
jgi:hypothetical protein